MCAIGAIAGAVAMISTVAACAGGDADPSLDVPPPSSLLTTAGAEAARSAVASRVRVLRTGAFTTRAEGSIAGQRVDVEATVAGAAGSGAGGMQLDERLDDAVLTQLVFVDGVLYGRIAPIGATMPPYAATDPGDDAADFYDKAFTANGRLFGAVDVLAETLAVVPGRVLALGTRSGDRGDQSGYRFEFDALDIGLMLQRENLALDVILPTAGEDATIIEVWLDDDIREIRTSGAMYQDGELIDDTEVAIEIDPITSPDITVPTDTMP